MLLPSPDWLVEPAEKYPLIFLLAFLGFVSVLTIAATMALRHAAEIVKAYYEFRAQVRDSKAQFERSRAP